MIFLTVSKMLIKSFRKEGKYVIGGLLATTMLLGFADFMSQREQYNTPSGNIYRKYY